MEFFLFLLVNATLFIRPAEIVPDLQALPIYNVLIVINLLVAAPPIIDHLTQGRLSEKPATVCVLGVLAGIFLSHALKLDFWSARFAALDFLKVVAYYLLLITTVNTRQRFFIFLGFIAGLVLVINGIAVLHYHGIINVPSIKVLMENDFDPETGELFQIPRMQATGIFGDPNDLSMIIVAGIVICAAGVFYSRLGILRFLLIAPAGFLVYALTLTQSRGGLLALMAGLLALFYIRFGKFKSAILGLIVIPVMLVAFGGRQTDIGGAVSGGTGEARAELWSEGLQEFKTAPIFGIGHNMYAEEVGQVAHNSFLHVLVELGLFGGTPFLGLFGILGISLWKLNGIRDQIDSEPMRYALPFILAVLVAWMISMMSLSRAYSLPTYLIAGIVMAYIGLTLPRTMMKPITLSSRVCFGMLLGSLGYIVFIYFYIKVMLRMG